jgi:nitroreductase
MEDMKKDALTVLLERKSVRQFTGEAVSKQDLETILKAAMAAPSARNRQPWTFIAITDRKTMDLLAEGLPYAKMLYHAQAAIVVCGVIERAHDHLLEYAVLDTSAATENILLAIEAMGLGGVWTALYPRPERMEHVRKVLAIPDDILPLCAIPIGHPASQEKPINKFKEEYIHWGKW